MADIRLTTFTDSGILALRFALPLEMYAAEFSARDPLVTIYGGTKREQFCSVNPGKGEVIRAVTVSSLGEF